MLTLEELQKSTVQFNLTVKRSSGSIMLWESFSSTGNSFICSSEQMNVHQNIHQNNTDLDQSIFMSQNGQVKVQTYLKLTTCQDFC